MKSSKFALGKEQGICEVCFQVVLSVRTLVRIKFKSSYPYFRRVGTKGYTTCLFDPFTQALANIQHLKLICLVPLGSQADLDMNVEAGHSLQLGQANCEKNSKAAGQKYQRISFSQGVVKPQ